MKSLIAGIVGVVSIAAPRHFESTTPFLRQVAPATESLPVDRGGADGGG